MNTRRHYVAPEMGPISSPISDRAMRALVYQAAAVLIATATFWAFYL